MSLNLNEEATLKIKTDSGQLNAELKDLNDKATTLTKTLREIEKTGPGKNSEEWRKVKLELDETRKASEALRKEVDITTLSYGQLENHVKQLARDLKTLKPGTDEFVAASAKLQTARAYLDNVNASAKGVATTAKQAAKDLTAMADTSLTFGELKTKIEQLKAKMDTLNPASKEFINTSKELQTTKKYYDSIVKVVDEATVAMHKQLLEAKNSELTYGQLETKVKLLNEQLKKLTPGTEDFVKAGKDLHQTEKDFAAVTAEANHLRTTGEELAKPTLWERAKSQIKDLSVAGVAGLAGLGMAVKEAITTSVAKFREFESAAADMSAVTGIVGERLDYLKQRAKEVGPEVGMSAAEMLDAYKLLASAKPELTANAEALASVTDQAIKLSKAGKIDLTQAAKLVAESLNQWGVGAEKAGEYVEVMAAGSKEGAAEMSDLSSSLKYAGTVAAAAGISFTQTNAVIQSLSTISIKGEQAGSQLRNMLVKLQTGAKDTNPAIVGLDKALENLEKKNLSTAQVTKMFGVENLVTAQHVISHRKEIAQMTQNMTGTQVATEQAATNMATLDETIKQGTATVIGYAVSLGQKLAPALTMGIQYGLAFLKALASLPEFLIQNRVLILGLTTGLIAFNAQLIISSAQSLKAAAVEKARAIAATLVSAADKIRAAEAARKAAAEALATTATNAGTVAENAATAATTRRTLTERLQAAQATIMATIDKGRVVVTNALTIAQNALNVAMKANPIGLIITAVTLLVAGFYTLYENNQKVRAAVDGVWQVMKSTGNWLSGTFGPTLSKINGFFSGLWTSIKGVGTSISDALMPSIKTAGNTFDWLGTKVKSVMTIMQGLWDFYKNLVGNVVGFIDKVTGGAVGKTVATFQDFGQKVGKAFTKGYDERIASEMPKVAKKAGEAAGKELTTAHATAVNTMTLAEEKAAKAREKAAKTAREKEQKETDKHLEEIRKANAEALKRIDEDENEAYLAFIKRTKGEVAAEKVKLAQILDAELMAIQQSLASTANKDALRVSAEKKYLAKLDQVDEEARQKSLKKEEEKTQKLEQLEVRRLENARFIIDQKQQAENALFDWEEVNAKNSATKLADIHQRRLDAQLAASLARNAAEEAADRAKAVRDATSKEQEEAMLTAIEGKYETERIVLTQKAANDKAQIEKELKEKKNGIWTEASNAFSALLKGDLLGFVEHGAAMFEAEKSAWQKRLDQNMAKYQAVAQMATAAVDFLNQLEQKKAENAIAEARRERDAKIALLNDQIAMEKAAQDAAELEKQRVTQESNDKIDAIKSASQSTIASLEQQYRQLSSSEEKKKLDEQLTGYKENAEGKTDAAKEAADEAIEAAQDEAKQTIEAAQKTEKESIKAATNEKNEKIDAAEATRDAEVAAINKRKDIDQATRQQLLSEAKQAFETTKQQTEAEAKDKIEKAKDTAKTQTELAKDTQKTKIELAEDQRDAELKAIEAVQKGDEKAAKEILAKAKEDQQEKIRLAKEQADKAIDEAEKEKREKLKKVEAEKQTRIQNQKELNRSIEAENKKAAAAEAAAKQKAWEAQKKADIASALITGALATLKALASSFWPANLVFAAMSAIMTGVQVAKIKSQPMPQFEQGGFIPTGGRHASTYGKGGIGLIDRQSGRDVGEMEGGEAIISRDQTQANMPLIQRMFANARTPGRRHASVTDYRDARGGRPAGFRDGGVFDPPAWQKRMYLYGGIPGRRRYDDGGTVEYDSGGSDGYDSGYDDAEAKAAADRAEKQGQEQLRLLTAIKDALEKQPDTTRQLLQNMEANLRTVMSNLAYYEGLDRSNLNQQLLNGLERLGTSLSNALMRISTSQTTDSKVIVAELVTLRSALTLALSEHRSQLVSTLGTNRLTNQVALSNLSLQLVSSLKSLSTDTTQAVENLEKTTATGLDKLTVQNKADFTRLTNQLGKNQDEATAKTILAITTASLANSRALASLSLKTVTSLDNLSDEMKAALLDLRKATVFSLDDSADRTELALAQLDKDMTRSLAQLNRNVTLSLEVLNEDVTTSLDILNTEQKQALSSLGNKTEQALERSATRTTSSIDGLSVEVRSLKGSINAVEGAVYQVRGAVDGVQGAVWGSNQAGRLDALIGAISTFGGK
ncbi:hypothetical protein GCM10028819_32170 [Spirosoma humi]